MFELLSNQVNNILEIIQNYSIHNIIQCVRYVIIFRNKFGIYVRFRVGA